jgi:Fe-S cluster assembly ATPase SufC
VLKNGEIIKEGNAELVAEIEDKGYGLKRNE